MKVLRRLITQLQRVNMLRVLNLEHLEKKAIIVGMVGAFLVVNALLSPFPLRMDFSKGQAYTLSSATKKVIQGVEKKVSMTFYVSEDLPTRFIPLKNQVTDLLSEYKRAGGSKVELTIVDPKKDQKTLEKAKGSGIPELQFSQVDKDKYAVTTAYFGIVVGYEGKEETLAQVTEFGGLEYNLTAALYKLTRRESPKVGIIGHPVIGASIGSPAGQSPVTIMEQVLAKQFIVEEVNVSTLSAEESKIDPSYKALMVYDNGKKTYSEQEIVALKEYLANGGKAVFFVDQVRVTDELKTVEANHDLQKVYGEWGITVANNLVLSQNAELVNFGNEIFSYMVPYPLWVKTDEVVRSFSYFSNVNQLLYVWPSSLTLTKKKGIETSELVKTSDLSWEQTKDFKIDPQAIPRPQTKDVKSFLITAEARNEKGGRVMVIPSSRFVLDRFLTNTNDNVEFMVNVMNDYASGGALTGIRQRAVMTYQLPEGALKNPDAFKYGTMLVLPVLFVLYGLSRILQRR